MKCDDCKMAEYFIKKGKADAIKEIRQKLSEMEEQYRCEIAEKDCMNDDPFSDGILSAMFTVIQTISQMQKGEENDNSIT